MKSIDPVIVDEELGRLLDADWWDPAKVCLIAKGYALLRTLSNHACPGLRPSIA